MHLSAEDDVVIPGAVAPRAAPARRPARRRWRLPCGTFCGPLCSAAAGDGARDASHTPHCHVNSNFVLQVPGPFVSPSIVLACACHAGLSGDAGADSGLRVHAVAHVAWRVDLGADAAADVAGHLVYEAVSLRRFESSVPVKAGQRSAGEDASRLARRACRGRGLLDFPGTPCARKPWCCPGSYS